jgi:hypothetical protein
MSMKSPAGSRKPQHVSTAESCSSLHQIRIQILSKSFISIQQCIIN